MLNVVCVLKQPCTAQLHYDGSWVQKLQRGVARNLTLPHRFVCLSDMPAPGVEVIPLQNDWMVYWSKIEVFRPGLFTGPTLYLDVDSMVTNNIDALAGPFDGMVMLTDHYAWFRNSGLMWWDASNPAYGELYARMRRNPISVMLQHRYKGADNYGDQEFIASNLSRLGVRLSEWQKIKPAAWFLEFSFENRLNPVLRAPPAETKLCYCLGQPKFDAFPELGLVREHWL